jgi:hypothetical protein
MPPTVLNPTETAPLAEIQPLLFTTTPAGPAKGLPITHAIAPTSLGLSNPTTDSLASYNSSRTEMPPSPSMATRNIPPEPSLYRPASLETQTEPASSSAKQLDMVAEIPTTLAEAQAGALEEAPAEEPAEVPAEAAIDTTTEVVRIAL